MSKLKDLNNSFPEPREEIKYMENYSAPLENRRNLLRLDFNENTVGPSPKVIEAIQAIKSNEISIYPEYNELKNKLCKTYLNFKDLDIGEIGIFNGADAAINAIFNSYGEKGELFLTTNPTFGYYSPCATMRGMDTIQSEYIGRDFSFPIEDFELKLKKYKPKLVFICNPNNPTGTVLKAEIIVELANNNKGCLFVIDELYEKFYGDSLLQKLNFNEHKNIILIQSFSKTAGLAGLRIGFAFGHAELITNIDKVKGPYDVNSFAVTAALAALDDLSYIEKYVQEVKDARQWIMHKFDKSNVRSHFSGGNYFLIWPNKKPEILEINLRKKGILVRNMGNKKDIENSIRVSIGTKEQMNLFWNIYSELDL